MMPLIDFPQCQSLHLDELLDVIGKMELTRWGILYFALDQPAERLTTSVGSFEFHEVVQSFAVTLHVN